LKTKMHNLCEILYVDVKICEIVGVLGQPASLLSFYTLPTPALVACVRVLRIVGRGGYG